MVDADDARAHFVLGEQARLGREVRLHGLVVVEVVLGEVGEGRDGKACARNAVQVDGMARHLQRGHTHARVHHIGQQRLQIAAFRRGAKRWAALVAHVHLDRAHEAGLCVRGMRGHVLNEKRRRRLSVRAGDAHKRELFGRAPKEVGRAQGQRPARVGHLNLGHVAVGERALDHEGGGSRGNGGLREIVAVCARARHAKEKRPGFYLRRGVDDVVYLHGLDAPGHDVVFHAVKDLLDCKLHMRFPAAPRPTSSEIQTNI